MIYSSKSPNYTPVHSVSTSMTAQAICLAVPLNSAATASSQSKAEAAVRTAGGCSSVDGLIKPSVRSNWNRDENSKNCRQGCFNANDQSKVSINANRPSNRKLLESLNDNGVANSSGC